MEKVIYPLWKHQATPWAEWSDALLGPVADKIASYPGARFLQIHVRAPDRPGACDIEAGLNIPDGVVSVWLPSAHEAAVVENAVADVAERCSGYSVVESTVLPCARKPVPPNGEMPGFSQLAFFSRLPRHDHSEFVRIWMSRHTMHALTSQQTFHYTQNIVNRPLTSDAPAWHGIVDEWYPRAALTDPMVYWKADGDARQREYNFRREIESVESFADLDGLALMISIAYRIGDWADAID